MNKDIQNRKQKILLVIVIAVILVFVSLFLQSATATKYIEWISVESRLIRWVHSVERVLISDEEGPDGHFFIDVSYSKATAPVFYDQGRKMPKGTVSITDRASLIKLVKHLEGTGYQYLLLDIAFEVPSEYDSTLQSELHRIGKNIMARGLGPSVISGRNGSVGFTLVGGIAYKFSLQPGDSDNDKSLPLKMFEEIHGVEYERYSLFGKMGEELLLNTFVIDLPINKYNDQNTRGEVINLNTFLGWSKDEVKRNVKDKLVVVGDFNHDKFETALGEMPRAMVLLNTYLSLKNGKADLNLFFLIYLFICYLLLSMYLVFNGNDWLNQKGKKAIPKSRYIKLLGMLSLISILAYVIFGRLNTVLFISVGIYFTEKYLIPLIRTAFGLIVTSSKSS